MSLNWDSYFHEVGRIWVLVGSEEEDILILLLPSLLKPWFAWTSKHLRHIWSSLSGEKKCRTPARRVVGTGSSAPWAPRAYIPSRPCLLRLCASHRHAETQGSHAQLSVLECLGTLCLPPEFNSTGFYHCPAE